jgi:hypothetical protein
LSNLYNQNPIILTATMGSGWKSLQTLNTGTIPANAQQSSGTVLAQPGIRPTRVLWTGATAQGHTFVIESPTDSIVLLQGQAGSTLADVEYFQDSFAATWKDFQLTQISSGTLLIWYRI